jgi:hypothetical protein
VVTGTEIYLGEYFSFAETVHDVVNKRNGVSVLDGNMVESSVVDAKAERAVLLPNEEDGHAGGRQRGTDESFAQQVVQGGTERRELDFRHIVDGRPGNLGIRFQFDRVVIRAMRRQGLGFFLREYVSEIVILLWDMLFHYLLVLSLWNFCGRGLFSNKGFNVDGTV